MFEMPQAGANVTQAQDCFHGIGLPAEPSQKCKYSGYDGIVEGLSVLYV